MKKSDLPRTLISFLLSFFASLAGVGCMTTAFNMKADFLPIFAVCGGVALFTALCLSFRFGWILLAVLGGTGIGVLFLMDLWTQLGSLLVTIFNCYDRAFDMGIPLFLFEAVEGDVTMAACVLAGFVTFGIGALMRAGKVGWAVSVAAFPFIPCLIGQESTPNLFFFFLFLVCILTMVLSKELQERSAKSGSLLAGIIMLPATIVVFTVFLFNPASSYVKPDADKGLIEIFLERLQRIVLVDDGEETKETEMEWELLTDTADAGLYDEIVIVNDSTVRLRFVGHKTTSTKNALEVSSSLTGTMYLRERGYGKYTGTAWIAPEGKERFGTGDEKFNLFRTGMGMYIYMTDLHEPIKNQNYLPYYSATDVHLRDGYGENFTKDPNQSYYVNPLHPEWKDRWRESYGFTPEETEKYNVEVYDVYTFLPVATLEPLLEILEENIDLNTDVISVADQIVKYIQSRTRYNANMYRMSSDDKDFVMWFLQEARMGHSVHYASAATALLRAAGIPARYVEGYVYEAVAGEKTFVTEQNIHSWVEYYLPNLGWVVLEATPGVEQNPLTPDPNDPAIPPLSDTPRDPSDDPDDPYEDPDDPEIGDDPELLPNDGNNDPLTPDSTEEENVEDGDDEEGGGPNLWPILRIPVTVLGALIAIFAQWKIRAGIRKGGFKKGDNNARGRRHWRYLVKLTKLLKEEPTKECRELALKARFSHHTLSDAEIAYFEETEKALKERLRGKGILWRFVYTIIFAAY